MASARAVTSYNWKWRLGSCCRSSWAATNRASRFSPRCGRLICRGGEGTRGQEGKSGVSCISIYRHDNFPSLSLLLSVLLPFSRYSIPSHAQVVPVPPFNLAARDRFFHTNIFVLGIPVKHGSHSQEARGRARSSMDCHCHWYASVED